jgi:hypothetical protein
VVVCGALEEPVDVDDAKMLRLMLLGCLVVFGGTEKLHPYTEIDNQQALHWSIIEPALQHMSMLGSLTYHGIEYRSVQRGHINAVECTLRIPRSWTFLPAICRYLDSLWRYSSQAATCQKLSYLAFIVKSVSLTTRCSLWVVDNHRCSD